MSARLTDAEWETLLTALPESLQPVGAGLKNPPDWYDGGAPTFYGETILDALTPAVEQILAARLAEVETVVARALGEHAEWGTPFDRETEQWRRRCDCGHLLPFEDTDDAFRTHVAERIAAELRGEG